MKRKVPTLVLRHTSIEVWILFGEKMFPAVIGYISFPGTRCCIATKAFISWLTPITRSQTN